MRDLILLRIFYLPGLLGFNLRHRYYQKRLEYLGENVSIAPFCIISNPGGAYVENDVGVASGCKVYSYSHHYRSFASRPNRRKAFSTRVPQQRQSMILGPIVIEDNVDLVLRCLILAGVTIRKNSFIRVNSAVLIEVPENSIAFGKPARAINNRFGDIDHGNPRKALFYFSLLRAEVRLGNGRLNRISVTGKLQNPEFVQMLIRDLWLTPLEFST